MPKIQNSHLIPAELIEQKIYIIREMKVMLDSDLAVLYQVPLRTLNQAVKRNNERFPQDFMFQLDGQEGESLRSQFVISKIHRGGRRYLPYVFTEQGVAMLASVLKSEQAIQASIAIIRVFVRLRELISTHKDLATKLEQLESTYDEQFRIVFEAIRQLIQPEPIAKKGTIGFFAKD